MKIRDFKLERYFAIHEFTAKYLLSSSDCDGYSMDYVLSCATQSEKELWNHLMLGYTESTGHPLLKDAILQHYSPKLNPNHVLVGSPGELAFVLMNVLLTNADHAIVMSPSYQSLYETINSLNCNLSFWKPNEENWHFELENLRKLIRPNTKLIVINFPHNPTGAMLSNQEIEELVAIAREHHIYIYSDEMYRGLTMSDEDETMQPIANSYEKGISLWGMAKSFGLAGLRIGWFVSQDEELLRRVGSFKDYLSICSSAPSEMLSIIALNHSEQFMLPNIAKIRKNIKLFTHYFNSGQSLFSKFIAPQGGSVAFLPINTSGSALAFSNHLVATTGIMTVPSEMFEYEGKFLRIGFGRQNFAAVLEVLQQYS